MEPLWRKKYVRVLKHYTVFLNIIRSCKTNALKHVNQLQKPEGGKKEISFHLFTFLLIQSQIEAEVSGKIKEYSHC